MLPVRSGQTNTSREQVSYEFFYMSFSLSTELSLCFGSGHEANCCQVADISANFLVQRAAR
jgi:hypothetical protein